MNNNDNKNQEHDHPLQYKWSLWHGQSWENLQMVASFQTVEGFWRLFNNLKPPSQFDGEGNYQLFKGKVEPKWEDRYNAKGGAWRYKFVDLKPNELNYTWYHTVLQMIGENFDFSEDICGLYLMIRKKKGHFELWIKDATNLDTVKALGEQFKKFCLPRNKGRVTLEFTKHSDAKDGKKKYHHAIIKIKFIKCVNLSISLICVRNVFGCFFCFFFLHFIFFWAIVRLIVIRLFLIVFFFFLFNYLKRKIMLVCVQHE